MSPPPRLFPREFLIKGEIAVAGALVAWLAYCWRKSLDMSGPICLIVPALLLQGTMRGAQLRERSRFPMSRKMIASVTMV